MEPPSSASSASSVFLNGVRGITMRPAEGNRQQGTLKWPKRKKETSLTRPCRLEHAKRLEEREERLDALRLAAHLHDDAVLAHVDNAAAELCAEHLDRLQVIALEAERLARRQRRRGLLALGGVLELLRERGLARELALGVRGGGEGGVRGDGRREGARARLVRGPTEELVLEVLGAEDGNLGEEELALDAVRVGVVEDGPYGYLDVGASVLARTCGRGM